MEQQLLGEFNRTVAFQYQNMLAEAGIGVSIDDSTNQIERNRGFVQVKVFVDADDYPKARMMVKEFEMKSSKEVEQIAGTLDRRLLLFFIAAVGAFLAYVIISNR